jgi:hypothetical protein
MTLTAETVQRFRLDHNSLVRMVPEDAGKLR